MIMEVKIQTLTPLWTGGVDGSMDRIHETGIIGSMRWWYEAVVRGLGGTACDPSSEKKCRYNPRDPRPPEEQLCPACQVFGATGWRRRFRVEIVDNSKRIFHGNNVLIPSGRLHNTSRSPRAGGWYIGPGHITQTGSTERNTVRESYIITSSVEKQIIPILLLIEHWGGLGAKNQLGYGVVGFSECVKNAWQPLQVTTMSPISKRIYNESSPALTDFFFAKIRFKPKDMNWWKEFSEIGIALKGEVNGIKLVNPISYTIAEQWLAYGAFPIAPVIRNWLHYNLYSGLTPNLQNFILGTSRRACPICYWHVKQDNRNPLNRFCDKCKKSLPAGQIIDRVASKVKISSAYETPQPGCWEFRTWGWIPQQIPKDFSTNRDKLLQALYDAFKPGGRLWLEPFRHLTPCDNAFEWYEFGAPKRDSNPYRDPTEFLNFLIRGGKL